MKDEAHDLVDARRAAALDEDLRCERATAAMNDLRDAAHGNARDHGFHDSPRTVGDAMILLASECVEAFEDFRAGEAPDKIWYEEAVPAFHADGSPILVDGRQVTVAIRHDRPYPKNADGSDDTMRPYKPCGVPSEIADVIVRALDFSGERGIDIGRALAEKMAYNRTRPRRHGGKAL